MSLEKEFEVAKLMHKCTFVKALLIKYYRDLQSTGATIPDFLQGSPNDLATKEIINLLDNKELFEKKYNEAYELLSCGLE